MFTLTLAFATHTFGARCIRRSLSESRHAWLWSLNWFLTILDWLFPLAVTLASCWLWTSPWCFALNFHRRVGMHRRHQTCSWLRLYNWVIDAHPSIESSGICSRASWRLIEQGCLDLLLSDLPVKILWHLFWEKFFFQLFFHNRFHFQELGSFSDTYQK